MDDLKFQDWSGVPQDKPKGMPMDKYFEFILFMRETFPPKENECRPMPAPVRFVIREDGEECSSDKK
jgi:hypothetical protein